MLFLKLNEHQNDKFVEFSLAKFGYNINLCYVLTYYLVMTICIIMSDVMSENANICV